MAQLKLIKFGAKWCQPCQSMDKTKVFERFKDAHPDVLVELHNLPDEEQVEKLNAVPEEQPLPDELIPFAEANDLAADYEVEHLPTILFVVLDEDGNVDEELVRGEEATSFAGLEKLHAKALRELSKRA